MSSSGTSIVSILNNDDHPSFAVRSNPRYSRTHTSPSCPPQQAESLPSLMRESQYARHQTLSESPTTSPRRTRHPLDPMSEVVQPISPGSSEGSAYDYLTSQPSSSAAYHPYARQDLRRDPYHYSTRGPAAPRTPPEIHSTTVPETKTSGAGGTRGTGRKNKYPCPYAVSHGCTATFTTSGHAARHGKKHTGEKSVLCPICNKAFTRKDNMKQHIRTHRPHSDDMRATSEPETEARWAVPRPDSSYSTATHHRTASETTDPGIMATNIGSHVTS